MITHIRPDGGRLTEAICGEPIVTGTGRLVSIDAARHAFDAKGPIHLCPVCWDAARRDPPPMARNDELPGVLEDIARTQPPRQADALRRAGEFIARGLAASPLL